MVELKISIRLRQLLPPLTREERQQLKANIQADGRLLDPIVYWNDGKRNVVIDGMHRWDVVKGTEIPYQTRAMKFGSYEEAEIWILDHQLGQRNLLDPAAIRRVRGELYNRLKRADQGHGDHAPQKGRPGDQIDTPVSAKTPTKTAAETVAEKAGVSPATIKRDAARVAKIEGLTKAAKVVAEKATDAEVKILAKLDSAGQDAVARAIRTGQASSVKEAIKQTGVKPPGKPAKEKPVKPPKQFPRSHWFKQWESAIGPVCRLVDKIANEVKEKHDPHHEKTQELLNAATKEMAKWMGVKLNETTRR